MTLPLILFFVASASMSFLWVRYLQTEVPKDDAFLNSFEDPWTLFKYVATGVFLALLCCALLREYLFYRWGIDCCRRGRNSSQHGQQSEDQRRVMALLAEEIAQQDIEARRQERRRKYKEFLAPYTMVSHVERIVGSVLNLCRVPNHVAIHCAISRLLEANTFTALLTRWMANEKFTHWLQATLHR